LVNFRLRVSARVFEVVNETDKGVCSLADFWGRRKAGWHRSPLDFYSPFLAGGNGMGFGGSRQ
jgi:hypothetical protein